MLGTTPLYSFAVSPVTSIIGVEAVSVTFAPITAPFSTFTPSTIIDLEPINAPSSIMTGIAEGGSSTPPMPTPPERCTSFPIWAQEPTVAQVSTIVPEPTYAPIFTNPGITTTPGSQNAPYLTTPGGTTLIFNSS